MTESEPARHSLKHPPIRMARFRREVRAVYLADQSCVRTHEKNEEHEKREKRETTHETGTRVSTVRRRTGTPNATQRSPAEPVSPSFRCC
jgi:hypothetical protein